jgi:hypothetical protein
MKRQEKEVIDHVSYILFTIWQTLSKAVLRRKTSLVVRRKNYTVQKRRTLGALGIKKNIVLNSRKGKLGRMLCRKKKAKTNACSRERRWGRCVESALNEKTIKHFTIDIKVANFARDVQRLQFLLSSTYVLFY